MHRSPKWHLPGLGGSAARLEVSSLAARCALRAALRAWRLLGWEIHLQGSLGAEDERRREKEGEETHGHGHKEKV